MDDENQIDNKTQRKRELTNARVKKYRKKKHTESQQLNILMQDNLTKEMQNKQIQDNKAERKRELAKEGSRRYRERKRLSVLESFHHVVCDSQIPGHLDGNSPFLLSNEQTTIHDSQIAGTSTNMDDPLIVRDDLENLNCIGKNVLPLLKEENKPVFVSNNLAQLENQVCASPTHNVQFNRSSATYSAYVKHSSAHLSFLKQFVQNEFGYACKICDRLWFKADLKGLNECSFKFVRTFLPNVDKHSIAVCVTCRASIQKNCIPKMAVYNGFEYPTIPDSLRNCPLDLVSERLISPRVPFMQIRRLCHVNGQHKMYGQIINVPEEVDTMVNKLPRNINDDHCIYVHIKQKKIQKSNFLLGLINKHTIKVWLQYLVNTPLYKKHNITIDDQFFDNKHFTELPLDASNENDKEATGYDIEDIPIEESLLATQQTVIWNDDLNIRVALGENNLPLSFILSDRTEELSFPSIYLGQVRQFRVIVTPFMMVSSELRRTDRRGVTPQHLLYLAMKVMRMRVKDSLTIAFKHKGNKCSVTKEEIQSEDYIQNCIESNLLFLRSIPNSTWYWSERKKDLFTMIRQLGKPTIFFSISANEMGWLDLLQLLYKLKTHVHITREEISQLHDMVKVTLINEDSVTCAIYFNKLVNVVMKILKSKINSPFLKYRVRHYFKCIKFQHGGTPQAHILAWLDNAPNYALNVDYNNAIELINTLMSVSAAEASGNIKLQMHKHTFTCYKRINAKKEKKCRFEAPFMPCKNTMILTPMKNHKEGFINYQKRYDKIKLCLENEDFENMDHFYNRNGIHSDEDYYNVLRAGITRPKVFIKREPSEKWHNPFNPFILNIVQSYTDFQFIPEEYSCAAYVVEYVNETSKGVSHLRRKIIETINEHPEFDIIDVTKNIRVNIVNDTEISSQEAAWYLLREPMSETSVPIVYIPTVWPVERQRLRKSMMELSELEDDCTDVWKEHWFSMYEKRPEYLESITLAQFVSKYIQNKHDKKEKEYSERYEPKIIRYRNYDKTFDFNEYQREMVTLHIPFRNEEEEVLAGMKFVTIYDDNKAIILQRRKEFESHFDIDKIIQICRELCLEETPVDGEESSSEIEKPIIVPTKFIPPSSVELKKEPPSPETPVTTPNTGLSKEGSHISYTSTEDSLEMENKSFIDTYKSFYNNIFKNTIRRAAGSALLKRASIKPPAMPKIVNTFTLTKSPLSKPPIDTNVTSDSILQAQFSRTKHKDSVVPSVSSCSPTVVSTASPKTHNTRSSTGSSKRKVPFDNTPTTKKIRCTPISKLIEEKTNVPATTVTQTNPVPTWPTPIVIKKEPDSNVQKIVHFSQSVPTQIKPNLPSVGYLIGNKVVPASNVIVSTSAVNNVYQVNGKGIVTTARAAGNANGGNAGVRFLTLTPLPTSSTTQSNYNTRMVFQILKSARVEPLCSTSGRPVPPLVPITYTSKIRKKVSQLKTNGPISTNIVTVKEEIHES